MTKPIFILLALLLGLHGIPAAQTIPPLLVVKGEGGIQRIRLRVSSVKVETRIFGSLAETRMTLVFHNPSGRRLAGDLYFPLPPGATISGYALDVGGVLRDAVVVEKDKGRQVFEKIVRQGLDPGLAEWTKGNTFKTRIFPIPPRGSRTVRIDYVSDLLQARGEQQYRLPLNFKEKIDAFSIRIEVVKSTARPTVRGASPPGFEFTPWRDSFVAEASGKNADLSRPLTVVLPAVKRQPVVVEKRAGEPSYFLINTSPPPPKLGAARAPRHITLYWDASASREKTSHQRALDLLKAFFGKHRSKEMRVDLVVFRDAPEKARAFRVSGGNPAALFAAVKALPYDGGTQLGALPPPAPGSEYSLLFSDGLSTFGKERPEAFAKPVYVFSGETAANQPLLRRIATESGGQFFDLNRTEQSRILARIGRPVYGFLGAKVISGRVRETYPNTPAPVSGAFTFAGKLMSKRAVVELRFGTGARVMHRQRFTLSRADAVEGGLVRLAWAQKKLDTLLAMPKRNRADMIELGRDYGLVTPGTSLIVLESFGQYVEHRIEPPGSLPEWRDRFLKIVALQRRKESLKTEAKLAKVIRLWKKQVAWWETEFDYAPHFRFRKPVKKSRTRPGFFGRLRDMTAQNRRSQRQAMRPPPPMAAPSPSSAIAREDSGGGLRTSASSGRGVAKARKPGSGPPPRGPVVAVKPWDPKTPYLAALRKTRPGAKYEVYLEQRKQFGDSPAFYLDSGDHFQKSGLPGLALRIWSNLAEMELENPALLRILAHRLGQAGWLELSALTFEEILRLRPEEPQSFRDLALVAGRRENYPRAIGLLNKVVLGVWDRRFPEIELIALMELNGLIAKARAVGIKTFPVDPRLVKLLDVDLRIILTWDADLTDMDLWVIEPSGEKAYYSHRKTTIGGRVSRDFTRGYGPEEYLLHKAMKGKYAIRVKYFSSRAPKLSGSVTLQVDIFTNFGRPNATHRSITVRLRRSKEIIDVGAISF